jgi:murein DD-endopeptidase MepM/ murein hydrolase activator NlpD
MALTAGQLQEARAAAAERANRSRRDAVAAATATQERAAARERAAWEQQHSKEIQAAERKAAGATDQQVFARVIKWVLPVRSFRLTAGFGQAGGMWVADHTGQDFAAPMGTPIRAVGDGEIISAAYDGPYGNRIVIRHTDGTETWYCHMSGYAHRSGWVRAGETIGYLGATGNTTGPHLHFEVHPNGGDAIDPLPWLRRLGLPI